MELNDIRELLSYTCITAKWQRLRELTRTNRNNRQLGRLTKIFKFLIIVTFFCSYPFYNSISENKLKMLRFVFRA